MKKGFEKILLCLPSWSLTVVCAALILYLTLFPKPLGDMEVPLFPGADKVVHAIMFGGLSFCIMLDLWRRQVRTSIKTGDERRGERGDKPFRKLGCSKMLIACGVSILFGGAIEIIQNLMHIGREGDVWDFVADACGVIAFTAATYIFINSVYGRESR